MVAKRIVAENVDVAMGIDVSKSSLAVTMLTAKRELKRTQIAATRAALVSFLSRFPGCRIRAAYEAGCFGYWLYDTLRELGVDAIVTPPSKLPRAPGERVKTDSRDSRMLASQLLARELKAVHVPSVGERALRQLVRTERQMQNTRVKVMNQIQSLLLFHHVEKPAGVGENWTRAFLGWLDSLTFADVPGGQYLRASLDAQLALYRHVTQQVSELKKAIRKLARKPEHERAVHVLCSTRGVGAYSAMIVLSELGDVSDLGDRFEHSDQFTAFLGIVPGEHSTGGVRHGGHITKTGNRFIRRVLVECAWRWVGGDGQAKTTFRRIARRREKKRAIVAMARRLASRMYWQLRQLPKSA
jgi:transposase